MMLTTMPILRDAALAPSGLEPALQPRRPHWPGGARSAVCGRPRDTRYSACRSRALCFQRPIQAIHPWPDLHRGASGRHRHSGKPRAWSQGPRGSWAWCGLQTGSMARFRPVHQAGSHTSSTQSSGLQRRIDASPRSMWAGWNPRQQHAERGQSSERSQVFANLARAAELHVSRSRHRRCEALELRGGIAIRRSGFWIRPAAVPVLECEPNSGHRDQKWTTPGPSRLRRIR
jgi:hypothetical protein